MGGSLLSPFLALFLLIARNSCCAAHHQAVGNVLELHYALQDPRVGVVTLTTSLTLHLATLETVSLARPLLITARTASIVLTLTGSAEQRLRLAPHAVLRFRQLTIAVEDPLCCQPGRRDHARKSVSIQDSLSRVKAVVRVSNQPQHEDDGHTVLGLMCTLLENAGKGSAHVLVSHLWTELW